MLVIDKINRELFDNNRQVVEMVKEAQRRLFDDPTSLNSELMEIFSNSRASTANHEGLVLFESMLRLFPHVEDTIDQRRLAVIERLIPEVPVTETWAEVKWLPRIIHGAKVESRVDTKRLEWDIMITTDSKRVQNHVISEIQRLVPQNLSWWVVINVDLDASPSDLNAHTFGLLDVNMYSQSEPPFGGPDIDFGGALKPTLFTRPTWFRMTVDNVSGVSVEVLGTATGPISVIGLPSSVTYDIVGNVINFKGNFTKSYFWDGFVTIGREGESTLLQVIVDILIVEPPIPEPEPVPTLTVSPTSITMTLSNRGGISVSVGGTATGTIQVSGLPSGMTVTTSANSITISRSSSADFSWSGNLTVMREGVSATLRLTISIVNVVLPTISVSPTSISMVDSNRGGITVSVGGTATGAISVTGLSSGITLSIAANSFTLSRPGTDAFSWSGTITVSRGGVSTSMSVVVSLTAIVTFNYYLEADRTSFSPGQVGNIMVRVSGGTATENADALSKTSIWTVTSSHESLTVFRAGNTVIHTGRPYASYVPIPTPVTVTVVLDTPTAGRVTRTIGLTLLSA